MKTILTFCGFILFAVQMNSQTTTTTADTGSVSFVAYWALGDSYNYKVTKVKQKWEGEKLVQKDSSGYVAKFEVIDSSAKRYKIKWTFNTCLPSTVKLSPDALKKLAKYDFTEVVYITNELGEYQGVENWKAISAMMKSVLNIVVEDLTAGLNKDQKEKLNQVFQPLYAMYASEKGINQLVFKELHFFHFPMGVEFEAVDEIVTYDEALDNLLGGAPLKGVSELYFDTIDYQNNYCVLVHEMKVDSNDSKRFLLEAFDKMKIKTDKETFMKMSRFEISDFDIFQYLYYPGLPLFISTERTVWVDVGDTKSKNIETIEIELLDD